MIIIANLCTEVYKLSEGNNFTSVQSQEFVALGSKLKETWNLNTKLTTIAGRLTHTTNVNMTSEEMERYSRIQFYIYRLNLTEDSMEVVSETLEFVPAARCKDLYAD